MTDREKELEAILTALCPAVRDVLWCALVWNDHNFDHADLFDKAKRAAKSLGYARYGDGIGAGVAEVNVWMARVDKALQNSGEQSNG